MSVRERERERDAAVRDAVTEQMAGLGFGLAELRDEARLQEDIGIDSTELVEIVVAMEKRFSIKIGDLTFGDVKTFGDVVAFLEEKTLPGSTGEV